MKSNLEKSDNSNRSGQVLLVPTHRRASGGRLVHAQALTFNQACQD